MNEYFGYLMLPMTGTAAHLDLKSPYDLLHYEFIDKPDKKATQKLAKQQWKFKKAMRTFHIEAQADYAGPVQDIVIKDRGVVGHVGDLRRLAPPDDENDSENGHEEGE